MFRLSLQPANPAVAKTWLIRCGVTIGGTGIISVAALVDRMRHMFPERILQQLPNYEQFIYMALGIAFITALPLTLFKKIITVSLAELGFGSSLIYIGYSLLGVFLPGYQLIPATLLVISAAVLGIVFAGGLGFSYREKSWSDLILGAALLLVFLGIWLLPLWKTWSHP